MEWFFTHRSEHDLTMESLYHQVGISRQGFHKYRHDLNRQTQIEKQIIARVKYHRQTHNRMGARPMHILMQANASDKVLIENLGRDKFERILINNGLIVSPVRVFHKTTYSGAFRFPNLVEGIKIKQINRIWVSDITYYRLLDGWAYLTFILDLYSRQCIGYALSENLITESTVIPALKMALKSRSISDYERLLCFHSDAGGQYIDHDFLKLLKQYNIRSSMAECVYENPHMERFHSTAKNDYLIPWRVNSVSKLRKELPRFVYLYNHIRPHEKLKYKTPMDFERYIQQIPLCQRPLVLFKKIT